MFQLVLNQIPNLSPAAVLSADATWQTLFCAAGLHSVAREPTAAPLSKIAFEFDRRKLTMDDVRDLIYREVLEYHPQV